MYIVYSSISIENASLNRSIFCFHKNQLGVLRGHTLLGRVVGVNVQSDRSVTAYHSECLNNTFQGVCTLKYSCFRKQIYFRGNYNYLNYTFLFIFSNFSNDFFLKLCLIWIRAKYHNLYAYRHLSRYIFSSKTAYLKILLRLFRKSVHFSVESLLLKLIHIL